MPAMRARALVLVAAVLAAMACVASAAKGPDVDSIEMDAPASGADVSSFTLALFGEVDGDDVQDEIELGTIVVTDGFNSFPVISSSGGGTTDLTLHLAGTQGGGNLYTDGRLKLSATGNWALTGGSAPTAGAITDETISVGDNGIAIQKSVISGTTVGIFFTEGVRDDLTIGDTGANGGVAYTDVDEGGITAISTASRQGRVIFLELDNSFSPGDDADVISMHMRGSLSFRGSDPDVLNITVGSIGADKPEIESVLLVPGPLGRIQFVDMVLTVPLDTTDLGVGYEDFELTVGGTVHNFTAAAGFWSDADEVHQTRIRLTVDAANLPASTGKGFLFVHDSGATFPGADFLGRANDVYSTWGFPGSNDVVDLVPPLLAQDDGDVFQVLSTGGANTVELIFTETIDPASALLNSAFTLSDGKTVTGTSISGSSVTLTLDGTFASVDGSVTIALAANSGIRDESLNRVGEIVATPIVNSDNEPPVITLIEAQDGDADGLIDTLVLTADEPITGTGSRDDWTVAGYNVTGAVVSSPTITLTIENLDEAVDGIAAGDTGATPAVEYLASGDIEDANGNALVPATLVATTDKAAPKLLSAKASFGSTALQLTFSEPIADAGETIEYDGGANAVTGNPDGTASFEVSLAANATTADFGNGIMVSVANVEDAAAVANTLASGSVTLEAADGAPSEGPTFESAETFDSDGDGTVDQVILRFSLPVATLSLATAEAQVNFGAGFTLDSLEFDDTAAVVAHLDVTGTEKNTDLDGTVTINAGTGFVGTSAAAAAGLSQARDVTDGAAPVLLAVTGDVSTSTVTVEFSEPVATAPLVADMSLALDWSFTTDDLELSTATTETAATFELATSVPLTRNALLDGDGVAVVAMSTLVDAAGNSAAVDTVALAKVDVVAPSVDSSNFTDAAPVNGFVDTVELFFDEDLDDTGLSATGWAVTASGEGGAHTYTVTDAVLRGTREVVLTLEERGTGGFNTDTGATLSVDFSGAGLTDLNLNAFSASGLVPDDEAPIFLFSATSEVNDDEVVLVVSETLGSLPEADGLAFSFDDVSFDGEFSVDDAHTVTVQMTGPLALDHVDGSETVAFDNAAAAAGVDGAVTTAVPLNTRDTTAPTLQSTATHDATDGCITQLKITFDDPMDANGAATTEFSLSGDFSVSGVTNDGEDDHAILLDVSSPSCADGTAAKPDVDYTGTSVRDINGNPLEPYTAAEDDTEDLVGPVLLSASAAAGHDEITLEFSEPVLDSEDAEADDIKNAIALVEGGSADDATVLSVIIDGTTAIMTLDRDVAEADFDGEDGTTVAAQATLEDVSGNEAADVTALSLDRLNPLIQKVETEASSTGDDSRATEVNRLRVTFTEEMNVTAFSTDGFTVTDEEDASIAVSNVLPGADDTELVLELGSAPSGGTGAVPTLAYSAAEGTLVDSRGFDLRDATATAIDKTSPSVVSVVVNAGSNLVTVTFSEAIAGFPTVGATDAAQVHLDAPGVASAVMDDELTDLDAGVLVLRAGSALTRADQSSGALQVSAAVLDKADNAFNSPAGDGHPLEFGDTTPPTVVGAATADTNDDGRINAVVVQFSETLEADSVILAQFSSTLGSITAAEVVNGDAGDDAAVQLSVDGLGVDTNVDLSVSVSFTTTGGGAEQRVEDLNGNVVANATAEAADGVPPTAVAVTGRVGDAFLTVTLSERVPAAVAASAFALDTRDDPPAAGELELSGEMVDGDASGDTSVSVGLSRALELSDLEEGALTLRLLAGSLADAAANANGDAALGVAFEVTSNATVVSAATGDADGDGRLDEVRVTISHAPITDSVVAADFEVAGYTVTAAAADGDDVVLTVERATALGDDEGDTAARPDVTLKEGASLASSEHGELVQAGTVTALDRAEPVVRSAYAKVGSTDVVLYLSEPLVVLGGVIEAGSVIYADSNPAADDAVDGGASGIRTLSLDEEAEDGLVRLVGETLGRVIVGDTGRGGDTVALDVDINSDASGNRVTTRHARNFVANNSIGSTAASESTNTTVIAVGASAALVGVLLLVALCVIKKKKRKQPASVFELGTTGTAAGSSRDGLVAEGEQAPYVPAAAAGAAAGAAAADDADDAAADADDVAIENAESGVPNSSSSDHLMANSTRETVDAVPDASREVSVPPPPPDSDGEDSA